MKNEYIEISSFRDNEKDNDIIMFDNITSKDRLSEEDSFTVSLGLKRYLKVYFIYLNSRKGVVLIQIHF